MCAPRAAAWPWAPPGSTLAGPLPCSAASPAVVHGNPAAPMFSLVSTLATLARAAARAAAAAAQLARRPARLHGSGLLVRGMSRIRFEVSACADSSPASQLACTALIYQHVVWQSN